MEYALCYPFSPNTIEDRTEDHITGGDNNNIDFRDPRAIQKDISYDPKTGRFVITEKIGDRYYRYPTYMTFEEFMEWQKNNSGPMN